MKLGVNKSYVYKVSVLIWDSSEVDPEIKILMQVVYLGVGPRKRLQGDEEVIQGKESSQ